MAITDLFFPTGMVLSEASDIINEKKDAPTLVHLVAMSINKESGDLEGNAEMFSSKRAEANTCWRTSNCHRHQAIRPSSRAMPSSAEAAHLYSSSSKS